jgi:uncharacterized protein
MNSQEKIISLLSEHKESLSTKYHIEALGLFGSYSRNDYNKNSDVDILVEFTQSVGIELIDLADELEEILHKKVDIVTKKGIKPRYLQHILKDLVYV